MKVCFFTHSLYFLPSIIIFIPCVSDLTWAAAYSFSIELHWVNLNHQSDRYSGWVASVSAARSLVAAFRFIWAPHPARRASPSESEQPEESSQPSRGRLDVPGSSVFISRRVTAERWSVSSQRPAGTVSRLTETDRRWTSEETCHRLTRLPAGGLRGTICFQLNR